MNATHTQRWQDRRTKFVPAATIIDPREYAVDIVHSERTAAPFLTTHHYLGTLPAARLSCGLYRNGPGGKPELVGIAVFSQPVNNASIPLRTGLSNPAVACDLGRLVLLDDVPGNGESWFVARALKLLRAEKPSIQSVIAYSDPVRQTLPDGRIILPGHIGHVYQALSATYTGRTQPRRRLLTPNGSVLSDRTISKVLAGDHGAVPAIDRLMHMGASNFKAGEDTRDWLARLEKENFLTRQSHLGCHAYTFPLARTARRALASISQAVRPNRDQLITAGDVTALPLFA